MEELNSRQPLIEGTTGKHPEQDLKPERTIHEIQRFLYSRNSRYGNLSNTDSCLYDRSQTSWTFTISIEELNTGHILRAAPASSQSRIFNAGVTNTLNPAFGFIHQSTTGSAVIKYITLWAQILPKNIIDQKQGWLKVKKKKICSGNN